MRTKAVHTSISALIILLVSPYAAAHTGLHWTHGLADGFMHPATGLDHFLVAIAAGYWAGRAGNHGVSDAGFFLALFLGGLLLGAASLAWPQLSITTPLLFGLVVIALAVAIAFTHLFGYALFGSIALSYGLVHMLGLQSMAGMTGFGIGLFLSTMLLLKFGLILRQVVATLRAHHG